MTIAIKGPEISRRGVLAGLGGMSFCLALGIDGVRLVREAQANTMANAQVTPWVRIAPDGTVTIYSAGAEMGQGSMTSLPLIVAEEMDADWSKVEIEFAPADADIYGYTFQNQTMMAIVGSRAVQLYYTNLRTAGAQVRKVLLANAAEKWGVDAATLKTEPGVVVNPANGAAPELRRDRRVRQGARDAAGGRCQGAQGPQGLPPDRQDRAAARHARQGERLGALRHRRAAARHGLRHGAALAGAHRPAGKLERRRDQEDAGRDRHGAAAQRHRHRRRAFRAGHGRAQRAQGDLEERRGRRLRLRAGARGLRQGPPRPEGADHRHRQEGRRQRRLRGRGQDLQGRVPQRLRLSRADGAAERGGAHQRRRRQGRGVGRQPGARRHPQRGGQGARPQARPGRPCTSATWAAASAGARSATMRPSARASPRRSRRPVKLVWTREEDIAHGMFRPQSFQCLEAAQDASGKVIGWKHCVVGEGGVLLHTGIKPLYYDIPNQHIERRGVSHGIRLKHWRAVGHVFNTFAIESLVDQMAADAGHGPDRVPLPAHVDHPEGAQVLRDGRADVRLEGASGRTAARSASRSPSAPARSAPAWSRSRSTAQTGKIRVHKVWAAIDGGVIVTPGAGQGQRRERHPLRPLQHAARARDHEGRRRGAVELPRLQPDAHVRPAGGDARRVRRRGHAADRARRDRQSVHRAARSRTRSSSSPASGCATCRSRPTACWRR